MHGDPRPDQVSEMGELGAHQVLRLNALPLVADQKVLIGCERLDALSKAPDKVLRLTGRGLAGDCLHETEHVLGAMADLAHQKMNLLLVSSLLGRIVGHGNEQTSSIRLGPKRRGNKVPESFAAILGVDYQFSRLRLRLC